MISAKSQPEAFQLRSSEMDKKIDHYDDDDVEFCQPKNRFIGSNIFHSSHLLERSETINKFSVDPFPLLSAIPQRKRKRNKKRMEFNETTIFFFLCSWPKESRGYSR